jgi:hypothetical protein
MREQEGEVVRMAPVLLALKTVAKCVQPLWAGGPGYQ